jgi:hypothetical protein
VADVAARHYWFVPVRLFMKDKFRSDLRAGKVTAPVLVVRGDEDTVVPITLGERLQHDPSAQALRACCRRRAYRSWRPNRGRGETVRRPRNCLI